MTLQSRPWFPAILWLALLGPFFFLTYGLANAAAGRLEHVPSIAFAWEKQLPFLAWTIVPYWSSDLLYALSLLICGTRRELNVHVARLVVAQVICVACFLLFPLRYEFVRPEIHGFFGGLFGVLLGFDRPFNEAPSLHVCLVVILWVRFRKHLQGLWGTAMNAWLVLIAISTMTTYQHQFLDVPTGALAGLLTLALVPEEELDRREQRFRLATFYFAGALFTAATACKLQGWGWILLWPALALLLVAAIYAADRPGLLRHFVVRLIVTPYTIAAWINSRWWTRGESGEVEIADGVWLGRAPRNWAGASIVNVAAELDIEASAAACKNVPMLDLVPPEKQQLEEAAEAIEGFAGRRPTLVCCALGYQRSASVVASWLVATGRVSSFEAAAELIRDRRPRVVLHGVLDGEMDADEV